MMPSQGVVQEVPVFRAWVSPCCLEPILLLKQGVGDDELMLITELQKQALNYSPHPHHSPQPHIDTLPPAGKEKKSAQTNVNQC